MKTPMKKETAKPAVKQDEVKAVETKAPEVAPVVEPAVETETVKPAAKKAEKEPKAAKKAAAPKAEKELKAEKEVKAEKTTGKTKIVVEYQGRQVQEEDLVAAVKRAWVGAGKKAADLKTMELYIKPEDGAVYYVINGENNGQVAF